MSLDDKLTMVRGWTGDYAGTIIANSTLNIPALHLQDGPQGVGDGAKNVTAWPSALTVVATWDLDLMYQFGAAMGAEQRLKGSNIMLGPMINIARIPTGGRNFESFGEDPYLTSQMVAQSVTGIQSNHIMACAKHYVDNNQEFNRTTVSENVPQRAQWEIYYPGFKAAVDAGVVSIMCSYNRINNTYACENNQTLNTDLKTRMGYQYFVMSDWGATHSTVQAANSGLDMQMPDDSFFGEPLAEAIAAGNVTVERLDDMVTRILLSMYTVGIFDYPETGNLSTPAMSVDHNILARQLAEAANVLVKNDNGFLPVDTSKVTTIAVIGDDASTNAIAVGCGSGNVVLPYLVSPLQGIQNVLAELGIDNVQVTYAPSEPLDQAVSAAQSADIAIVFVGTYSCEGSDRANLSLPNGQDDLVSSVAQAQPNTAVVVNTPGAILMPWLDQVQSVLVTFLPGQEDGNAAAAALFGQVNPSGKLPVTFPASDDQVPANTTTQYPGIDNEANYSEGILVGYRWYDALGLEPLFPFGHGLSYTTFNYSNLVITSNPSGSVLVLASVTNNGTVEGAEVVQFYLGFPSSAGEPPKVLRGFQKVLLAPGQTIVVGFELNSQDRAIWDVTQNDWSVISGTFDVYVGSSSRDIRLAGQFNA